MNLLKKIKKLFGNRAVVLMYHRVGDVPKDPWELAVNVENFEQQLQVLQKDFNVITVKELVRQLNVGKLEKGQVCITFDDGYRDNLLNAIPLLKKYRLPATFFIPTGFTGSEKMFWWDAVYEILGDNYFDTWQRLQSLPFEQITERLDLLIEGSGKSLPHNSASYPMNTDELKKMVSDSLFSLGVHTVTHPALGMHDYAVQEKELLQNRKQLYTEYENYTDVVAYPYGHYNRDTLAIMRNNNFEAGFTTHEASINAGNDIYQLGRFQVKNIDGKLFKEQLQKWLHQ